MASPAAAVELRVSRQDTDLGRVPVTIGVLEIGSHPSCQVHLPDPQVAPLHARLAVHSDVLHLEVVNTQAPTELNGLPVTGNVRVLSGDDIHIGLFRLSVRPAPVDGTLAEITGEALPVARPERPRMPARRQKIDLDQLSQPLMNLEDSTIIRPILPELSGEFTAVRKNLMDSMSIGPLILPPGTLRRKHTDPVNLDPERADQISLIARFMPTIEEPTSLLRLWRRVAEKTFGGVISWAGLRSGLSGPIQQEESWGLGEPHQRPDLADNLLDTCLLRHQYVMIPPVGESAGRGSLAGPVMTPRGPVGMLFVSRSHEAHTIYSGTDLDFFKMVCMLFGAQMNWLLFEQGGDKPASAGTTRALRKLLDAGEPPVHQGWAVCNGRISGMLECTDLADAFWTSEGRLAVMLASVHSGGSQNVLLLGQVQAAFRLAAEAHMPLAVAMRGLNRLFHNLSAGEWLVEAVMAIIRPSTGEFQIAQAGTPGMRVLKVDGGHRQLRRVGQPILGEVAEGMYQEFSDRLQPSERLVLYSNGVAAAVDSDGEAYGRRRVVETLTRVSRHPLPEMLVEALADVRRHLADAKPARDITYLLVSQDK